MATKSALYVYDFTLSVNRSTDDKDEIISILNQLAKKWCFQKEDTSIEVVERNSNSDLSSDDDESVDWSNDNLSDYDDVDDDFSDNFSESDYSLDDDDDYASQDNDDNDNDDASVDWSNDEMSDDEKPEDDDDDNEHVDSGYLHWQGRVSLIKKKRLNELVKLCKMSNFYKFHWSATSKEVSESGNLFYVQKADTRVDGPWSNIDEAPPYIPRQIRQIEALRPWQQEIIDSFEHFDTRTINIIYDEKGNIGKSTLSTYCGVNKLATTIPPLNNYKELLSTVMDRPVSKAYFIDFPRSLPKVKLYEFYSAIESVKNGYVFDTRYKFVERYFDSPNIWIFSNVIPDKTLLTRDRWVIWEIRDNKLEYYGKPDRVREVQLAIEYNVEEDSEENSEENFVEDKPNQDVKPEDAVAVAQQHDSNSGEL